VKIMAMWAIFLVAAGSIAIVFFSRQFSGRDEECARSCSVRHLDHHTYMTPGEARSQGERESCRCW